MILLLLSPCICPCPCPSSVCDFIIAEREMNKNYVMSDWWMYDGCEWWYGYGWRLRLKKDVIRKCSKNNSSDRCTLIKVNIPDRQIEDHHLCYSYEQNIIIIVEEYLLIHISNFK